MNAFIKFNKGMMSVPVGWQIWLLTLVIHNMIVPLFYIGRAEATINLIDVFFAQKQIRGALAGGKEDLEWGLEQVKSGHIRPLLQQTFPLSQVSEAHRLVADGTVQGNLVLLPWE